MAHGEQQSAAEAPRQSRVGKRPVPIPKGVTLNFSGTQVDVQGPKGKLSTTVPSHIELERQGEVLLVRSTAPGRDGARWQGLSRALIANMVKGVAEGYERILDLVGTGYRCEVKGRMLHLSLGFSHPVVYPLPDGVNATVAADSKGTVLVLTSVDKALLGQVAATVRAFRPPEPYAGKGVRYRGEQVRRKAGKAGKK